MWKLLFFHLERQRCMMCVTLHVAKMLLFTPTSICLPVHAWHTYRTSSAWGCQQMCHAHAAFGVVGLHHDDG
jgi:hypothetical protein